MKHIIYKYCYFNQNELNISVKNVVFCNLIKTDIISNNFFKLDIIKTIKKLYFLFNKI